MKWITSTNTCAGAARRTLTLACLPVACFVLLPAAPAFGFGVELWPNGVVSYRFYRAAGNVPGDCAAPSPGNPKDLELCDAHKTRVRAMMDVWEDALRIDDPSGRTVEYVRFQECVAGVDCPTSHVVIRYNRAGQRKRNNMCTYVEGVEKVGRNPNGTTTLHFTHTNSIMQPDSVILHELGHCLGLWHEHNRADRDRWLVRYDTPRYCAQDDADCDGNLQNIDVRSANLEPLLGNYDYDSIMHYPSYAVSRDPVTNARVVELRYTDAAGNAFLGDNWNPARPLFVSTRDVSRVLQYQAYAYHHGNGFFQSLSTYPPDPDRLPNSYLDQANEIGAVGSPAIAHQSPGNYDVFARGSDLHIYWKSFRRTLEVVRYVNRKPVMAERNTVSGWRSIGCCFWSDPSAVSREPGKIDVVAINNSGEVQRIKHIDGTWYAPLTLRGGAPTGGIRSEAIGTFLGPAIASRAPDLLDVFVVRDDGRLAVTTWRNGNWETWQTLGETNYEVTARPAAVALSAADVRLAINENRLNLYEPSVTFGAGQPSLALGANKGTIQNGSPPALTTQHGGVGNGRSRVLVTNQYGRISVRGEFSVWRDIGGIPMFGTGPAAVATDDMAFMAVMNGEHARGCGFLLCDTVNDPAATESEYIQPGGLWIRHFN